MADAVSSHEKARAFFDRLWKHGDPWRLDSSAFEGSKYAEEIAMLDGRRYTAALEIGCGAGAFTRLLAPLCDRVLALDVSAVAIDRARTAAAHLPWVEFREQNVFELDLESTEPWDLIVMSETVYYLGWLHSFFDVAWLASELHAATRAGGRLLMANTCGGVDDHLMHPWIIRTYRDLFVNVGYELTSEKTFSGVKQGAQLDVLISLFTRRIGEP